MSNGDVLLADEDRAVREELARSLRRLGYEVSAAAVTSRTALRARTHRFKYAAVDVNARRGRGLDLVSELRRVLIDVRIVAMVQPGTVEAALEAMGRGAHFYLMKPIDTIDLSNAFTGGRRLAPRAQSLTMARVEWDHLQRILGDCDGNVSETARRLGITRRTVQLKLKHGPPT
jgi:two-component system response regulator RegA